ncbi:MAG: ABC transporter permease [Microthrixaceae bacterium]
MRFVDIMLGIPYIILAYAFITVLGRGVTAVVFTLALTAWLQTARTVRAGFIQVKELEYVEAARALGVSSFRIMVRHILPNVFQPVVVLMAVGVGSAILSEAALSFLGVGIQPPEPSLGPDGQRRPVVPEQRPVPAALPRPGHRADGARLPPRGRRPPRRPRREGQLTWGDCSRSPTSMSASGPRTASCRQCAASTCRSTTATSWPSSANRGPASP